MAEAWYYLAVYHVVHWFGSSSDPFQPVVIPWNIGAIASIYLLGVWLVSRHRSTRTRAMTKSGSDDSYGVYLAQLVFITALGWCGWRHLNSYLPWPITCLITVVIVFSACVALTELLARGIRVGLGTDGPASNNDLDLWEEMRFAAMMARIRERDPSAILAGAARILRPGGYLALDTPNARVCRVQQPGYIDPDHDYEYTHAEMTEKLHAAGFEILEAKGLNLAARSVAEGMFSIQEVATRRGLFADIEDCYLLSYLCRTPAS